MTGQLGVIRALEQERDELKKQLEGAEFWSKWVYPKGASPQQIQNELIDYHHVMGQVPKVYDYVTGGLLSKHMYLSSVVIAAAEDHIQDLINQAIEDEREVWESKNKKSTSRTRSGASKSASRSSSKKVRPANKRKTSSRG